MMKNRLKCLVEEYQESNKQSEERWTWRNTTFASLTVGISLVLFFDLLRKLLPTVFDGWFQ